MAFARRMDYIPESPDRAIVADAESLDRLINGYIGVFEEQQTRSRCARRSVRHSSIFSQLCF